MALESRHRQEQKAPVEMPRTTVGRPERANGKVAEPKQTVISLKNLNVYYGDSHAVRDVSHDIAQNAITAFIGPKVPARALAPFPR